MHLDDAHDDPGDDGARGRRRLGGVEATAAFVIGVISYVGVGMYGVPDRWMGPFVASAVVVSGAVVAYGVIRGFRPPPEADD